MRLIKEYSRTLHYRTFLYTAMLLFLGIFNPGIPELKSNVRPGSILEKAYPADFFKVSNSNYRNFSANRDIPFSPLRKKQSSNNTESEPISDQCFYKVGRRAIADKGPESAMFVFSGIFLGSLVHTISFISRSGFVIYSSWTGSSSKIRPPPVS